MGQSAHPHNAETILKALHAKPKHGGDAIPRKACRANGKSANDYLLGPRLVESAAEPDQIFHAHAPRG
jgi:hypothetical protein